MPVARSKLKGEQDQHALCQRGIGERIDRGERQEPPLGALTFCAWVRRTVETREESLHAPLSIFMIDIMDIQN